MNVRSALNLSLLALAALLAALVYWEPGIERPVPPPKLTALAPVEVAHIAIQPRNGAEIRIDKDAGDWMMSSPVAIHANEFRIDALLRVTQADSHARIDSRELDLAKFGLEPPATVLRLNDIELAFGDSEPINNRRYVRVGATVHLIDDDYYYRLQADYTAFVSNRLLPPQGKPTAITLPSFDVARAPDGQWTVSPAETQPSMDAINGFVDEWRRAQAVEIDRFQGGSSQGAITVSLEGDEAPVEFLLVETEPETVLARADIGLRFHLTAEQARRLLQPPSSGAGDGEPE